MASQESILRFLLAGEEYLGGRRYDVVAPFDLYKGTKRAGDRFVVHGRYSRGDPEKAANDPEPRTHLTAIGYAVVNFPFRS
jgi:hypothetical protein